MKIKYSAVVVLLASTMAAAGFGQSLGVYLPGISSAAKVSDILKSDENLKKYDINVFSKYKDFAMAIKAKDFNYVLSTSAFLEFNKDHFDKTHQFLVNGQKQFNYSVVALDKKWSNTNVESGTLCVVETLERDDTKNYLGKIFANKKFKRIKNISKAEDIYPILAMGNADVALVSPEIAAMMKSSFATDPKEVVKSEKIDYFVVAKNKTHKGEGPNFKNLSQKTLAALGASGVE